MEKPKFNGDVSNLSRDIRTYCFLQRKQGFEGHTQLSMVEMFLQRLLKTPLYAHKADKVLRLLCLRFPDHQFADLASESVRATRKSQDVLDKENNLDEEFLMDTLVSRWTSFPSRRERSDRTRFSLRTNNVDGQGDEELDHPSDSDKLSPQEVCTKCVKWLSPTTVCTLCTPENIEETTVRGWAKVDEVQRGTRRNCSFPPDVSAPNSNASNAKK